MKQFDYVIVGAGSAGCVLAHRLSEDPKTTVLLLEAGKRDGHILVRMPLLTGLLWNNPAFNWGYESEPEPHLNGRKINIPRGKLLGGSSSINAMIYARGHPRDYDQWRQMGAAGWDYASVLPYFKRAETNWRGETKFHGGSGPLQVTRMDVRRPIVLNAFREAGKAAGYDLTDDPNGADPEGFGDADFTVGNGRRSSTARAYLHPAMSRPNLKVETHALASKILFEGTRAIGIEYRQDGRTERVQANREVILSGGAINSPHLLMLSGVGPAEHLREHGIEVVLDSPGVGQNLEDHISAGLEYSCKGPVTLDAELRFDRLAVAAFKWLFAGDGTFAYFPFGGSAYIRTRPELDRPDIQFLIRNASAKSRVWFPGIRSRVGDAVACRLTQLHPESVGSVTLRSASPEDKPRIIHNYFAAENDLRSMREGIKAARKVFEQKPLADLLESEKEPGPNVRSDDEIDAYIRETATTIFHPVATCRMGPDPRSVVDSELRVKGIGSLRVVDASIMPHVSGSNTNAPTIMIAEKAADMIRGQPPLPPVEV